MGVAAGRLLTHQVADQVALHHAEPAAFVEIRHRDADRGTIDNIVGDHRAFKTELGVDCALAEAAAGVADDLQVGRAGAAHRGERGVADAVAAHDDVVGAEHVDGIAVLAGTSGFIGDVFDAVVDDERAVVAGLAAPDQNAAVAGALHRIAGDAQACGIVGEDRVIGGVDDGDAGHFPAIASSVTPLPPALMIMQSIRRSARPCVRWTSPRPSGSAT